jgi:phospholipid/cholesterol/gamma-HCH transport system substrate-binding protein
MYATRTTQFIVGIFAILGIVALAVLSISLGKISLFPPPGYTLYASFDNISGLKVGDQVQLAGVQIGKVVDIEIKNNQALIAMRINEGVKIDDEAIAAIKTSGIIGDKYVSIQLGPGDHDLADDGVIKQTQSAFVLEDAIAQLINNSGSSNSSSSNSGNNSNSNCNCSDTSVAKKPGKSDK